MTTLELKTKIHQAVDNASAETLQEILDLINSKSESTDGKDELDQFIDRVFKEDDNLLRRLAQ
ncbi:hypothetical protein HK413_11750 [Mucilaginibacter sp. S1162]|uniref:Uncharacterized protein n=1 Tax=Mucilaginibacter humi TaxID=2732510 RepID=A0ABX1W2Y2_9SPHI|nr:hypothetical protein [Mucilaginibacter humi]NNU34586.1 hypothetical protein [Mucilaginibacter humi]